MLEHTAHPALIIPSPQHFGCSNAPSGPPHTGHRLHRPPPTLSSSTVLSPCGRCRFSSFSLTSVTRSLFASRTCGGRERPQARREQGGRQGCACSDSTACRVQSALIASSSDQWKESGQHLRLLAAGAAGQGRPCSARLGWPVRVPHSVQLGCLKAPPRPAVRAAADS